MSNKDIFRKWCALRNDIPLFLTSHWMDAITDDAHWDVALVGRDNDVQAFLPYFKKRKVRFDIITMPPLTPYMGPWLHYPKGQKQATRLSYDKRMMEALITQLPATDRFIQYFHPAVTNWLPFQWHGFEQTTRYTYVLPELHDLDAVYNGFQGNIKREIRKAEALLTVESAPQIETLFALLQKDYAAKGEKLSVSRSYLQRIHEHMTTKNRSRVFLAKDAEGCDVASLWMVWDAQSAYFLAGASDPTAKTTGVMSLLLWTAIREAALVSASFNFEGSMMEPIERFFRAFGGTQTPYFEVRKTGSRLLKLL